MPELIAGILKAVPDAFDSVWNFFYAGKLFMLFLLALSVLSIAVVIYKALDLRRRLIIPEGAERAIETLPPAPQADERAALANELRSSNSMLGRLGLLALSGKKSQREDTSHAVESRAREEVSELESGIALLEVVITIAPMLGLLGTVSGLVNVFSNLGDGTDRGAIAAGIAEALNTTIAGLAIAVPTVIAHSFFMKKIERLALRTESLLGQLIGALHDQARATDEFGGNEMIEPEVESEPEPEPEPQPEPEFEAAPASKPAPPPAEVEVQTAVPDPGVQLHPEQEKEATPVEPLPAPQPTPVPQATPPELPDPAQPQPQPSTEPGIPRLLAGHPPASPSEAEPPAPAPAREDE